MGNFFPKNLGSKQFWSRTIFVQENFSPKIMVIKKRFDENLKEKNLVKKILLMKILVKTRWVKKLFGKTKVFVSKNLGPKKLVAQNNSSKKKGKNFPKRF